MAKDPLRLSRSRWDSFIKCPKCFYLKEKYNIGPPSQPGHPINSRVDALLKEEFDLLRKDEKPHAIFKEYNLNFIPYNKLDPEVLAKYRNNFKGVEAKSKKTASPVLFIPNPESHLSFAALEATSRGTKFPKAGYLRSK